MVGLPVGMMVQLCNLDVGHEFGIGASDKAIEVLNLGTDTTIQLTSTPQCNASATTYQCYDERNTADHTFCW
jgi:hypothetical protein